MDFENLSRYHWYASWDSSINGFYAKRTKILDGKRVWVKMHREILSLRPGDPQTVDHKNHDTLDNRRNNLRLATHEQQRFNQRNRPKSEIGLKGVTRNGSGFQAEITANGIRMYLGTRRTAEAAHALYCEAALRLHGEFACF
jgi:hypothetical protein